jgi:hypothetical protein
MTIEQFDNYFHLSGKILNNTASHEEIKEFKILRKDFEKLTHISVFQDIPLRREATGND